MSALTELFIHHAARAFFASAWADACEEAGESSMLSGQEILHIMPDEIDPAARVAAVRLAMAFEDANKCSIADAQAWFEANADGSGEREPSIAIFGHYAAMQAVGHGVGLSDAFGSVQGKQFTVPYIEFGSHSLEKDYF